MQICNSRIYCILNAFPRLWTQYQFTLLRIPLARSTYTNDAHFVAICDHLGRFPLHVTDKTEEKACYGALHCAALF